MRYVIEGEIMNKEEFNIKAKELYNEWLKKTNEIEKNAKENGVWKNYGLDTNNHLFTDLNNEYKEKMNFLKSMLDE